MSVTEKMCFNPLRPLRTLIPLNYLSPLIRFFKPLNLLNCTHFFASSCCYAPTCTHSQEAGNVRQETWERICETVRRSETDRRRKAGKVRLETLNRQEMWNSWRETGDRGQETWDRRRKIDGRHKTDRSCDTDRRHEADRGRMIGDRRAEKDRKSKERQETWERRREIGNVRQET